MDVMGDAPGLDLFRPTEELLGLPGSFPVAGEKIIHENPPDALQKRAHIFDSYKRSASD
jgi:hypothetical protein